MFQRQGRSDSYATEFDLEAEEYVPLPKGDVHKKKEVIQDVTLHDLDIANARPQVTGECVCVHACVCVCVCVHARMGVSGCMCACLDVWVGVHAHRQKGG